MKNIKIITGMIVIGAAIIVVFFGFKFRKDSSRSVSGFVPVSAPVSRSFGESESLSSSTNSTVSIFKNSSPKFSLEYPKELVGSVANNSDGSVTFSFLKSASSSNEKSVEGKSSRKLGFQIFVSPYKEQAPVNIAFIKETFPLLTIKDPVEIVFGASNSVHGLAFESSDPSVGATRELWFAHDGYLYQVTTYLELDSWLAEIFKSWRF